MYIGDQHGFGCAIEDLPIDLYSIFLILQLEYSGISDLILDYLLQALFL